MIGLVTPLIARLGRRAVLYVSLALALIAALGIAMRQGRRAAEASYAIRRADARIRALQTAKDTRHDVETASPADRDRRLDRWMRD
jgi:O-antigen ligase